MNTLTTTSKLHKRIMRRVYVVHALRLALNPMVIKPLIALAFVFRLSHYVSPAQVFENMPREVSRVPLFVSGALRNTEAVVLILTAGALVAALWFARDLFVRRKIMGIRTI